MIDGDTVCMLMATFRDAAGGGTENARLSYRSRDNASRLDKVHVMKSDNYPGPDLHPRFNPAQTVLGQTFVRRSDTQIVFYIPSPGKMCPTVIDKSQPIESMGSRLRGHTRIFDSGVRARSNSRRTLPGEGIILCGV